MDESGERRQAKTGAQALASKRGEISRLDQFLTMGELITLISDLVHNLQRERGASNLYLASGGRHFVRERQQLCCASDAAMKVLEDGLRVMGDVLNQLKIGERLSLGIADALSRLRLLGAAREQVAACGLTPESATALYDAAIQSLLDVLYETADAALDAAISASLLALFSLMQAKELSGQERAAGARGLARSHVGVLLSEPLNEPLSEPQRVALLQLIAGQQAYLQRFAEQADAVTLQRWQQCQSALPLARLAELRAQMQRSEPGPTLADTASDWFTLSTQRIDAMKDVEDFMAEQLRRQIGERLAAARTALEERELIEGAKSLLMSRRALSEDQAHRLLRQMAMNQSRRLPDLARAVIEMAALWR